MEGGGSAIAFTNFELIQAICIRVYISVIEPHTHTSERKPCQNRNANRNLVVQFPLHSLQIGKNSYMVVVVWRLKHFAPHSNLTDTNSPRTAIIHCERELIKSVLYCTIFGTATADAILTFCISCISYSAKLSKFRNNFLD